MAAMYKLHNFLWAQKIKLEIMCRWFYWYLKWPPQIDFLNIFDHKKLLFMVGDDIGLQSSCSSKGVHHSISKGGGIEFFFLINNFGRTLREINNLLQELFYTVYKHVIKFKPKRVEINNLSRTTALPPPPPPGDWMVPPPPTFVNG